jgi:hypothetical protein
LVGQQIGLHYIVPKAISVLQADILAEGDYYPGDLLNSVLSLSENDWDKLQTEKTKFIKLLPQNISIIEATENRELIRKAKAYVP